VPEARPAAALQVPPVLPDLGVEVRAGGHDPGHLEGATLVVTSPGVPPNAPVLAWAAERGLRVWGELEVGARVSDVPYLAVLIELSALPVLLYGDDRPRACGVPRRERRDREALRAQVGRVHVPAIVLVFGSSSASTAGVVGAAILAIEEVFAGNGLMEAAA